ncbi:hypothetical protein PGTUg99_020972 [Puccinia graminis f. sp. tritici]|nr:hypothetical protein PGTUg99_020972 [Puccinia graminis f. sp. tritici]
MFQFFYPFREVDENKGFQSLKFALKSYYQSPFLNILKVLGDLSNRRFAESLIVYQSLKFKADIRDPFENVVKKAVDCLCQNNGLLKALEEGEEYQLDKSVEKGLIDLIKIFKDDVIWTQNWRKNEAIMITGKILELVVEHGLKNAPSTTIITSVAPMFDDAVIIRLKLLNLRNHVLLELKNIHHYLETEFPLSKGVGRERISPLEELNLIGNHIRESPLQLQYRETISKIKILDEKACTREMEDQVQFVGKEIEKLRKLYSEPKPSALKNMCFGFNMK